MTRKTGAPAIPGRYLVARIISWFFLFLSVAGLCWTVWRSGVLHGEGGTLACCILPAVGVVFWGLLLLLGDETRLNAILMTVSFIVSLYVVEIFLHVTKGPVDVNRHTLEEEARAAGMEFDERSPLQVYMDLKRSGIDAALSFSPGQWLATDGVPGERPLFPLGGVSRKQTVLCNENGQYTVYPSDRHGFNNPDSAWDLPITGWVLTGDSYTHGCCVSPGQDIAGQIRAMTGSNVINLGSRGNGPLVELAVLREFAEDRKPERVLWFYYEGNDFEDLRKEKESELLMQYLAPGFSQGLASRQDEVDERILASIPLLAKSEARRASRRRTGYLRLQNVRDLLLPRKTGTDDLPLLRHILAEARDQASQWGGTLYFVYLPAYNRYAGDVEGLEEQGRRAEVLSVAGELGIPVIDIHREVFSEHPDPLSLFPFRSNAHYTPEGYAEVSRAIVAGVKGEEGRAQE